MHSADRFLQYVSELYQQDTYTKEFHATQTQKNMGTKKVSSTKTFLISFPPPGL